MSQARPTNPFSFGDLALDDAFADREAEVAELVADMKNGQNVLIYAPRRYGKSSLVSRAATQAVAAGVLVAYVDLMRTPTKERLAAALAKTIYEDLAPRREQLAEQVSRLFGGLRIVPVVELDPQTGTPRFTFDVSHRRRSADIDDTIERLLELPQHVAGERRQRAVLVLDEFQEVVRLDRDFPNLMRAVFQTQPEVAHVYLGSKRHVLDAIFDDRNEPFWRSAKRLEIGTIPAEKFRRFIALRFDGTDKAVAAEALDRVLAATGGHPYGTQELCYFVWGLVPEGHRATVADVEEALGQVLRSEHNHFTRVWDEATDQERLLMLALADEPTAGLYSTKWQHRHGLASSTHVQRAATALVKEEIVGRDEDGEWMIIEPFLADWLKREQADSPVVDQLRRKQGRRGRRPSVSSET